MDFAVITVSDRCSEGSTKDVSGEKLESLIKADFPSAKIFRFLIPDDKTQIKTTIVSANVKGCSVIFTTGGTGFAPRDVTPEATREIIEREAPALAHAMTMESLKVTPMAMLSRAVCGILGKSVVINLPGSPKAAAECYESVKKVLRHGVDLLKGDLNEVRKQHGEATLQSLKSRVILPRAADRSRHSPYPMIEVKEALSMIQQEFSSFSSNEYEVLDIDNCLHRILGEDVFSDDPLPPFPASTKDGYAVITSDGAGERRVHDVVAAGDRPSDWILKPGEIARINTGAPLPPGADAVVQVEDTEVVKSTDDGDELIVLIKLAPTLGQDIRSVGCDIPANSKILSRSEKITPAVIGLLASIGKTEIKVKRQHDFSVGIISTGNELQDPRKPLKPGQIYDSNKHALIALLKKYNFKANDCGSAKDNPDDVFRTITSAISKHDVIITTGGVSMGEFDVVKRVLLDDFGAKIYFGRVNMKPGKPTTFAVFTYNGKRKFVFALPGNPVSAMVTTILFVLPALRNCGGNWNNAQITVTLEEDLRLDPRPEYMRAFVHWKQGELFARITGDQISSRLNSLVGANALIIIPGATSKNQTLSAGTKIQAIPIDDIY